MFGSDGIKYFWRRIRNVVQHECITHTPKHSVSSMIWGCMPLRSVGRIGVFVENINVQRYMNEKLGHKLLPSAGDQFQDNEAFLFKQDSASWCVEETVSR